MTDALLFLHLLSAAALFAAAVAFTALVLGARLDLGTLRIFTALHYAGLLGVFVFGLALAFDIDAYQPWDGWVLIAIALWLAAGATGDKVSAAYREAGGGSGAITSSIARTHWIYLVIVLLLLADMVGKPWA